MNFFKKCKNMRISAFKIKKLTQTTPMWMAAQSDKKKNFLITFLLERKAITFVTSMNLKPNV